MARKQTRIFQIILLIVVLAAAVFQFFRPQGPPGNGGVCEFPGRLSPNSLAYSSHARCRMKCREVSQGLVEDVYRDGALNCDKSDPQGTKDGSPRYALEMEDGSRGRVRIIVGDNSGEHVIITVIRLDEKDHCTCP
jgi:hypothetical protein